MDPYLSGLFRYALSTHSHNISEVTMKDIDQIDRYLAITTHQTVNRVHILLAWWRHQTKTFSALLSLCAGNSPVIGEIPAQRPVTRSFDVSFYLRLNKRLGKQSWGWWFETPSCSLWRHRYGYTVGARTSAAGIVIIKMALVYGPTNVCDNHNFI